MSLISLFSFSPRGSRSTKALLSTFGASLVATARGGTSGGGLELCCSSGTRLGGNMLVWKGFPRVEWGVQDPLDPLETGVVLHEGSCWVVVEVPKLPGMFPQAGQEMWRRQVLDWRAERHWWCWGRWRRGADSTEDWRLQVEACRDNPSLK